MAKSGTVTPSYYLSLGMLSIPLKSYPAARDVRVELKNLHAACAAPLKMAKKCSACGEIVNDSDLVKGYETGKDKYLTIAPDDIRNLGAEKDKTMDVKGFVKAGSVDPVHFGPSNFIGPASAAGNKAFILIRAAMEANGVDALVQYVQSQREKIGLLRVVGENALMLHELFYQNEVRTFAEQTKVDVKGQVVEKELALAKALIEANMADGNLSGYSDKYAARLNALIEAKMAGQEAPAIEEKPAVAETDDLMAALEASLKKAA